MRSTTALLLVVIAATAGRARVAHADDGSGKPWFPMIDPQRGPDETFDLNALSVIHVGDEGWRVNRGKYRESVSRHDFFVTIGRNDLAARETADRTVSITLVWCGAAAALVGTWMVFAHLSPGGLDPSPEWGLGLIGAGAVSAFVGTQISGPTLSADEADGLTRHYNEQLKAHIEDESGEQKAPPVQAAWPRSGRLPVFSPYATGRSGFGFMALARF